MIGPEQHDQTVSARLHDTLVVNLSRQGSGWRVEFDRGILEPVGAASLGTPAAEGWSFRCVGTGTSELVFTVPAAPCPSGAPCPPSSFEFHARVDVKE